MLSVFLGKHFRKFLRLLFLWLPLGMMIERYQLVAKLIDQSLIETFSELYMALGPILRKIGPWLPIAILAFAVAAGVPTAARNNDGLGSAVKDRIQEKMDKRGIRHGQAEAEWLAGLDTLPMKPDGALKILMSKTDKNRLLRIDIRSDRYDLKPLITSSLNPWSGPCRSVPGSMLEFVWCADPEVIIGAQRIKSTKILDGRSIGQPVYIHPAKLGYKTWLNRLTFYARAPVDSGALTFKTMRNVVRAVPLVQVSVTDEHTGEDLLARRKAEKRAAIEAEKRRQAEARRLAAERQRQTEIAQARALAEQQRLEAEAEKARKEEAEQERLAAQAKMKPAKAASVKVTDLSGLWKSKTSGMILRLEHNERKGTIKTTPVRFTRKWIETYGDAKGTSIYIIDPVQPDKFSGLGRLFMPKEYATACPRHPTAYKVNAEFAVMGNTIVGRYEGVTYRYTDQGNWTCDVVRTGEWKHDAEWVRLGSLATWWHRDYRVFRFIPSTLIALTVFVAALIVAWGFKARIAEHQKEEAELIDQNIKNLSDKLGL